MCGVQKIVATVGVLCVLAVCNGSGRLTWSKLLVN